VLIASLALCALRIAVAASTGLTDDEAYYRLWGLGPALSYLDHPPMAGWLIWLGQHIAGDTALGLRLLTVLAPLAGTLLTWRTAGLLFGPVIAERACWIGLAIPLLAVGGIIMTPDTPSVVAWGLTSWAVAELWYYDNPRWWLAVGLFAGLGLISKYTNLFAGAGIVLWLLVSGEYRRHMRHWHLWAGGAIALACTAPVVAWNQAHHWASFTKQFGRVAAGQGFTLAYLGELIGSTFGLLSPAIAILAVLGIAACVTTARKDRRSAEMLLLCSVVPMAAYLIAHATHDRVQPNWPAPIFPALGVLAALGIGAIPAAWAHHGVRLRRAALPLGFAFIYFHALSPLVHLPGEADPTAQMQGWADFDRTLEARRVAEGAAWIATSSYATTGQLAFQEPSAIPVLQINERLRYINLPPPDAATLQLPGLYVELDRRADRALLRRHFRSVTALESLSRMSGGVPIATYALYRVADPRGPVLETAE
jgi:4-amino-4-deoxy-L-arabinose transferase-like glycosyltransferase